MQTTDNTSFISHAVISANKSVKMSTEDSMDFFDLLSTNLYQNSELAAIRETVCNAWDAHIAAGKTDTPIDVEINEESFSVTDYGNGINHEDFHSIYGTYGGSTKKKDETQTGGFGLGTKAPFAYVDHFTVHNTFNNLCAIYSITKSDITVGSLPAINQLTPTFKKNINGVKVSFSLKKNERSLFKKLFLEFISLSGIKVNLNGELVKNISFNRLNKKHILFSDSISSHIVKYGSVTYPIPNEYKYLIDEYLEKRGVYYSVPCILLAEPDSLVIHPSREVIRLCDKNKQTIINILEKANQSILKDVVVFAKSNSPTFFINSLGTILFTSLYHYSADALRTTSLPRSKLIYPTKLNKLIKSLRKKSVRNNAPINLNNIKNKISNTRSLNTILSARPENISQFICDGTIHITNNKALKDFKNRMVFHIPKKCNIFVDKYIKIFLEVGLIPIIDPSIYIKPEPRKKRKKAAPVSLLSSSNLINENITNFPRLNGEEPITNPDYYVELSEFETYRNRVIDGIKTLKEVEKVFGINVGIVNSTPRKAFATRKKINHISVFTKECLQEAARINDLPSLIVLSPYYNRTSFLRSYERELIKELNILNELGYNTNIADLLAKMIYHFSRETDSQLERLFIYDTSYDTKEFSLLRIFKMTSLNRDFINSSDSVKAIYKNTIFSLFKLLKKND